ncbi:hypothetical protein BV911_15890 [Pseudoruegeria sp. SK021]|nr:DnaA/Hda family protein [Pseudoruegeria sp. SK021]OSP53844.1 hypothetical protein BV911_15890 [Pseudoruegeria sp. SK021]
MTGTQLLLDLEMARHMGRADFLLAPSNAAALAALDDWRNWPLNRQLLCGPKGSGRTHLLRIWQAETGAALLSGRDLSPDALELAATAPGLAVDDADRTAGDAGRQETLFHLFNLVQSRGVPLLLAAPDAPGTWGLTLPDLESRVQTCPIARLQRPDDHLLRMVLCKLCDDRQLAIGDETLTYLVTRMDRALDVAYRVVNALDHEALSRQKRVSRTMAAEVLSRLFPNADQM